jgi:hypothetical protein
MSGSRPGANGGAASCRGANHRAAPSRGSLRRTGSLAAVALALFAGCGSSSGDPPPPRSTSSGSAAAAPDRDTRRSATAYARAMRPVVASLARLLRGADLTRNARDFDRGVALLRERRAMARITADPALLLAHDRLAKAVARAGTLLVAAPGSELAVAARRAGVPPGTQTAVALVGPELVAWSSDAERQLRAAGVPVPSWLPRERDGAQAVSKRARDRISSRTERFDAGTRR